MNNLEQVANIFGIGESIREFFGRMHPDAGMILSESGCVIMGNEALKQLYNSTWSLDGQPASNLFHGLHEPSNAFIDSVIDFACEHSDETVQLYITPHRMEPVLCDVRMRPAEFQRQKVVICSLRAV